MSGQPTAALQPSQAIDYSPTMQDEDNGSCSDNDEGVGNWERGMAIVVCLLNLGTTGLSLNVALQPTSCCGQEIKVHQGRWATFGLAVAYFILTCVEMVLIVFRRKIYLCLFNPFLGYTLTIWMLFSANIWEAWLSTILESAAFVFDIVALWKVWKERRWIMFTAQFINFLLAFAVVFIGIRSVMNGGVCLYDYHFPARDEPFDFDFEGVSCFVCHDNGLPANNSDAPCLNEGSDAYYLGEYCGDDAAHFCFKEFKG